MNIQQALALVLDQQDLEQVQMEQVMTQIMTGEATPSQIGGFLIALRMKGESVDEVTAAATVMRKLATRVEPASMNTVDIVGTGGDTTSTFNVSTASALVAATAGVKVAKHGNRSVSSKSGAADFLEAAGVNLNLQPAQVAQCVDKVGVGFMFAQNFHSAMKHAIGPRREMGVRTIFNLLGPLTNPAGVPNQVLGVFDADWVLPLAQVLQKLGSQHVLVVHSNDGMDEISCCATTQVAELKNGQITELTIDPASFGITGHQLAEIQVDGAKESFALIESVMDNKPGAALDIVRLNAGAAIYVGGLADTLKQGVVQAGDVIASGKVRNTLDQLVALSNSFGDSSAEQS